MSENAEKSITPLIDLERSELRYIFYAQDQSDLIADFEALGFEKIVYSATPITRTIYFGSNRGLRPGLSIKARIYSANKVENTWHITSKTQFNLLEIKSTINPEEFLSRGEFPDDVNTINLIKGNSKSQFSKDLIVRIQRASADGLLKDSTLKSKSRLKEEDFESTDVSMELLDAKLNYKQIVKLLTQETKHDKKLSDTLTNMLNVKIRSIYQDNLVPIVMTQYARIHLVPKDPDWRNAIRVTIDPGVEFYDLMYDQDDFLENPDTIAQYMTRENFSRLEFKINPNQLESNEFLSEKISEMLLNYGCVAYLSKKWTGVTLVSEQHIHNQPFWREPINKHISGFFPVDPSWFEYGTISAEFYQLIRQSKFIEPYEDNPRILVKNENFVEGYLGVPVPSLVVRVEGPEITYALPSKSYPVKLTKGAPEFYITEEEELPVRRTTVTSKKELNDVLHDAIWIEGDTYFRSFGFLVKSKTSNRTYKLTIERKLEFNRKKKRPSSQIYCKMRYIGTINKLHKPDKESINRELEQFYDEFAPIMAKPIIH